MGSPTVYSSRLSWSCIFDQNNHWRYASLGKFFFFTELSSFFIIGAQIVDLIMLVIDITKGMQTQTAECLVIGEITCDNMVVVLNKIDQIPIESRDSTIAKVK